MRKAPNKEEIAMSSAVFIEAGASRITDAAIDATSFRDALRVRSPP